ncbi:MULTISPECIES: hypothetical protein [unclassified Lysinibacillus]|nr:hypothetical protein [Lysinibacillus sp. SG55]
MISSVTVPTVAQKYPHAHTENKLLEWQQFWTTLLRWLDGSLKA